MSPNQWLDWTAEKLRFSVPSAQGAPTAAQHLVRRNYP